MFESAELGSSVAKAAYKKQAPDLRASLLEAQAALASSDRSLLLVIGGVEGAGKTEFANTLLSWLDAHSIRVHAWSEPSDEERGRPYFWRFWRRLPAKRQSGFFLTSWYSAPIVDRVFKRTSGAELDEFLDEAVAFERMLVQEGVILVKLWFHLSKRGQKERFKELEADPDTRWRVTALDWKFHKKYDRFRKLCERAIMKTSQGQAPWTVIEGTDRRYRDLAGGRAVLDALKKALAAPAPEKPVPDRPKPKARSLIRNLDLSRKLDEEGYEGRLEKLQGRLGVLTRRLRRAERSLILAFEGPDAAGKGGAIRRLTAAMDARLYRVDAVAAPTDEEKAHPYLWRFWRNLPWLGRTTIYDRSWYGRVLVERVEGFASRAEWSRAYGEINAFEAQLADFGTVVRKFWLAISPEEQLRRFKERETIAYKKFKIGADDWRNREKWDAYEAAACEMIERTSTTSAPWVLVEAEDKSWARIKVLSAVVEALEQELS